LRDLPGYKWLLVFILYSVLVFIIGVIHGDSVPLALIEFKGFIVYPLIIVLIIAGVGSERILFTAFYLMTGWFILLSGRGIMDFLTHAGENAVAPGFPVYRESAGYAPINIFGATAMAMALLVFGVSFSSRISAAAAKVLRVIGVFLIVGGWTSASRASVVLLVCGFSVLFLIKKQMGLKLGVFIVICGIVISVFISPMVIKVPARRIFQVSDSSTKKRSFYLISGLHALKEFWPAGAGWGNAFWYSEREGLIRSDFIPWYHNDYLNLAVQTGIPGLILYLGFWFSLIRFLWKSVKDSPEEFREKPFTVGGMAALTGLLVSAMFEHFLWRPDMAGFVAWIAGMAVADMRLREIPAEADHEKNRLYR